MPHAIRIDLTRPIADVLKDARKRAAAKGGSVTGDDAAGAFSGATPLGAIEGTYRVSGRTVELEITQKPMILGLALIEQKLREFFA
jgi:hypothetical protein